MLTSGAACAGAAQTRKTAKTGTMRRIAKRLARDSDDEPEGVEGRVQEDARVDAVRSRAEKGEPDSEDGDHGEACDEPVDEAERDADEEDRRGLSEALEQTVARAAELELLDDRRDDDDEDRERGERRDLARVAVLRDQALFALRVCELVDDSADDEDREQDSDRDGGGAAPRGRP